MSVWWFIGLLVCLSVCLFIGLLCQGFVVVWLFSHCGFACLFVCLDAWMFRLLRCLLFRVVVVCYFCCVLFFVVVCFLFMFVVVCCLVVFVVVCCWPLLLIVVNCFWLSVVVVGFYSLLRVGVFCCC